MQKYISSYFKPWNISFILLFLLTIIALIIAELSASTLLTYIATVLTLLNCFVYSYADFSKTIINKKTWKLLSTILLATWLMYGFLRILDVYHLTRFSNIKIFCENYTTVCQKVSSLFFQLKVYRFITLSSSFFLSFLFLFSGLHFLSNNHEKLKKYIEAYKNHPYIILSIIGTSVIIINNILMINNRISDLAMLSWQNKHLEFYDRFVPYESGIQHSGWIWEYGKFLKKHIPEDAVIFVPPQEAPWPHEGNVFYFRWFVYPITVINTTDSNSDIPEKSDFVIITNGAWKNDLGGWPKKKLDPSCIEKIVIIDRKTVIEEEVTIATVDTKLTPSIWGYIKLKKVAKDICL